MNRVDHDVKSPADQAALAGVVIAGALSIALTPGNFDWWSTMLALVLGAVLYGYSRRPEGREVFAMSAAAALVTVIGLGRPLLEVLDWSLAADEGGDVLVLWGVLTILWFGAFALLDRRARRQASSAP